ncbi:PHD domain-containing protein [Cephalotus follicularis]|uniref:PHD domain-containing protein n=1 Tax=Cephalotus follicularis TaxID=3775 RepID=A0A1Q3B4G6_CEPFO|nr:PHD domain-containing protein [Cephalotus follicularis]
MGDITVCEQVQHFIDANDDNTLKPELKRGHQFLVDKTEPDSYPNKKQLKETSNEDIKSEVSNPIVSPIEAASSFHDITSQHTEFVASTCSEETVVDCERSRNSTSPSETLRTDAYCDDSTTSQVVLEIPKNVSTTGIRKVTFKFSKRKEHYDNLSSGLVAEPPGIGLYSSYYEDPSTDLGQHHLRGRNMEVKMLKKVLPNNYPTNVKKLLSTGILDGARVNYISSNFQVKELNGIIDGGGYLCGCSLCNYAKVLSAYEFEQHAGFKTRHPNNHIFLENGKPIYSIIQELKTAPLSLVGEVIKDVAGSSVNEEFFQSWKAGLQRNSEMFEADMSHNEKHLYQSQSFGSIPSEALEEAAIPSSCSHLQNYPVRQQTSFVRETYMKEMLEEQKRVIKKPSSYIYDSVAQQKKTTDGSTKKRDNDLHRLLFMPNGLPDGAELAYYVKGQRMLGGYKQGNGIVCSCCDTEISPSQFEAHAGMAARRQPYRHIYTSNGLTLHDIAISLANGQSLTTGGSDDMCAVCGGGGSLLLCDGCPRAFHQACLGLQCAPEGDWHCPNCRDKSGPVRKPTAGESSSMARPIVIRLTRVVKAPESEIGGCAVCRGHDFSAGTFDERTVILCDQCEKEFHVGCLRDSGLCDLKKIPNDKWFCCDDCNRIHMCLQNSVSNGAQIIEASLLNTLQRKHGEKGLFIDVAANNVQWRILSGKSRFPEHLPLLSRAAAIFRECFDPIVAKSGRDLIPVMVYGRNISGQEFGGMYCVVLTVKSFVVSAGLLRIFGQEVAELPLVATSREYQGKGYFQALFSCIERLLCSLNVKNLVLPAAEEAESIWLKKFGFRKMSNDQLLKYQRELQLTIFKGTSMLEKEVQQISE